MLDPWRQDDPGPVGRAPRVTDLIPIDLDLNFVVFSLMVVGVIFP
jgi:hypothetical protein